MSLHGSQRDDVFSAPLYLWMAALGALSGKTLSDVLELLDETLTHEQRFRQKKGWAIEMREVTE